MKIHAITLMLWLSACASAPSIADKDKADKPADGVPPSATAAAALLLHVSHPKGLDAAALRELFGAEAPRLDSLKKCDFDFQAEKMLARSTEQLYSTVPHYVIADPLGYHWCFYAKMLELEEALTRKQPSELTLEEKQALILDRYPFFITVGRIFRADFNDSRYLEFAVFNYRRLSRAYFGRELDLSPKIKGELELPGDASSLFEKKSVPADNAAH